MFDLQDLAPFPQIMDEIIKYFQVSYKSFEQKTFPRKYLNFNISVIDDDDPYAFFKNPAIQNAHYKIYQDPSASIAQLIAVHIALNHSRMAERALRARNATLKHHYAHYISRCAAFSDPKGIWNSIKTHVRDLGMTKNRHLPTAQ
jgi:hypothetical protein